MLIAAFFSCNQKNETTTVAPKVTPTAAPKTVGSDLDTHGCKTSAGYTWSSLRNDCVRIFEVGTRLDPVEPNGMSAFVILDAKVNKAEVFTLLEKQPVILTQVGKGTYTNGNWELITHSKLAKLLYKGKVTFIQPE